MSDAQGSDPLLTAVRWIQAVLLGEIATSIAIIAVAGVGMAMLAGHLDWRRGARVVMGCFILFAAPTIALGLLSFVGADEGSVEPAPAAPSPLAGMAPLAPSRAQAPSAAGYDPYAGASVGKSTGSFE